MEVLLAKKWYIILYIFVSINKNILQVIEIQIQPVFNNSSKHPIVFRGTVKTNNKNNTIYG